MSGDFWEKQRKNVFYHCVCDSVAMVTFEEIFMIIFVFAMARVIVIGVSRITDSAAD